MNFKLEQEFSKTDIIKQVDDLKSQIDAMRPLPADVEGRVMQKLRLDWNYHSNAIEGNRLNYGETVAFLMEGITAKGKPLKDHLDIRGHNEAINFLLDIVKDSRPISEADIRNLHTMILVEPYQVKAQTAEGLPTSKQITLGEYKTSANHVKTATGETHYYATPEETPAKMHDLMAWYNEIEKQVDVHPLVMAALFHHKFVAIHPFDDGNGRLSRILMNLILMQKGYPPVVVKMEDRINYYSLLSRADRNDNWPFVEYIAENLLISMNLYLKAANGGNVEEDEDLDKELALIKMDLLAKVKPKKKATIVEIHRVLADVIYPLIKEVVSKLTVLYSDVFEDVIFKLDITPQVLLLRDLDSSEVVVDETNLNVKILEILNLDRRIKSLYFGVELKNFKNPDFTFNVSESINCDFEDQEYSFDNNNGDLDLYKSYDQNLSSSEKNLIIRTLVKGLTYWIEDNLKSQN